MKNYWLNKRKPVLKGFPPSNRVSTSIHIKDGDLTYPALENAEWNNTEITIEPPVIPEVDLSQCPAEPTIEIPPITYPAFDLGEVITENEIGDDIKVQWDKASEPFDFSVGEWNSITVTVDAGRQETYVNGELKDVKVFGEALSEEEIKWLATTPEEAAELEEKWISDGAFLA